MSPIDEEQIARPGKPVSHITFPVSHSPPNARQPALAPVMKGLRDFLRVRTSYDVLPLSFRLIILDNDLLIKKSLNILIQNGIVSAPLWDSHRAKFAGLLTATDYINLIQYYCQFPEHIDNVDKFRLSSLRDIEKAIGVLPIETVSVHPSKPLYEACRRMLKTRARRIPLVDIDDETGRETVVSVITQYRILKFIAVNTEQHTSLLKKTVREIGLGTYTNLQTGSMTQSVLEIINAMVTNNISAVPIVDKNNVVLNVFEAIDVIPIIKTGVVEELEINVGEALSKRGDEFGGIFTCQEDDRLDSIFITLRQSRQDRHLPSEEGKGKGKELVVATWPSRRPSLSQSVFTQAQTAQDNFQTSNNTLLAEGKHLTGNDSSNTWTSSSENPDLPSEDGKEDRESFILEYNRLAQRHGIRSLVPEDFPTMTGYANDSLQNRRSSWFSKMLRQVEQSEQAAMKPNKPSMRHQLNPSDTSSFVPSQNQDKLKNQDLKALVRLCGKSPLFLPKDYAPSSLTLPTCLRALAQALVQYVGTEGLFRVPGSARVVDALYDYYCDDGNTDVISNTTRCPTLPSHIRFDAHDLASTFKRFLAGLPGGILGSLSLFDALVAIYSQFQGEAEFYWTKESKLRARLIALAIGTVKSQFQRELICAVFGLLCFVGRAAKTAPREDENGRPLPTSSLMGYNALGVVFGPLLIGNSINDYSMKVADPSAGLILLPIAPQSRDEKRKHKSKHESGHRHTKGKDHEPSEISSFTVDKVHIANSITEMLIVHWREVVRQMRSTGSVKTKRNTSNPQRLGGAPNIASSGSENFSLQNPTYLDHARRRSGSPSTASPTPTLRMVSADGIPTSHQQHSMKAVPHLLSPMIEESPSRLSEAPNTGYGYKRTVTDSSDLSQEAYPISPNRVHGSSPDGSVIRFEATTNKLTANDETLLSPFRSSGPQKSENSSLLPSLVRRNMRPHRPRMGRPLPGSGQSVNATTIETNSSTSLEIEKSALLPKLSVECLPRSITNPQICETGCSTPSGSVDLAHTHPRARNKTDGDGEASAKSPVGQWRHFIASGNSSTESLAKSTRERRMRRARGHSSPRPIRQALTIADPNSTTAEEKQLLIQKTGKSEERPTIVQPEKKDMSTETPRSTRPTVEPRAMWISPDKHSKDTLRREDSQRSASKPMPGAVKAMAALFNNAAKESPGKPAATPSERAPFKRDLIEQR
ncbi:hypothetical protein NUW58_g7312 [Xylaria curta]|uniref:Uncharacterized protein n=1 Tax=Xylaria curta TaxID=42375 RepID=A0ACC1NKG7_9PEZI|nr:hypothetical protein NUW58_g7312 [Xylaria curta]